jgi:hypothetical protein
MTGEARPSLLGHHSSNGTAAADHLPVPTEGYELLVKRRIVVVRGSNYITLISSCLGPLVFMSK